MELNPGRSPILVKLYISPSPAAPPGGINRGIHTEGHTPLSTAIGALPSVGAQKQPDGTEGGARRGRPYG